jgi:hypothetical protein
MVVRRPLCRHLTTAPLPPPPLEFSEAHLKLGSSQKFADYKDLNLETRYIDSQWEWEVTNRKNERPGPGLVGSLGEAQEPPAKMADVPAGENLEWQDIDPALCYARLEHWRFRLVARLARGLDVLSNSCPAATRCRSARKARAPSSPQSFQHLPDCRVPTDIQSGMHKGDGTRS